MAFLDGGAHLEDSAGKPGEDPCPMRRFRNILALYDDSVGADDVLSQAVALARENAAHLTLVDVVFERYATEAKIAERRKLLERMKSVIAAEGVRHVDVHVFRGTAFLEVIHQVLRSNHDLVIASAEGGSRLRNVFFGSTATHLMRKAPCPVWIVKPGQSDRYQRILACIDPAAGDGGADDLNHSILRLAISLSIANFATLHVVHAWEIEGKDRDTIASEIRDDRRLAILRRHEGIHMRRVRKLLASHEMTTIDHQLHLPRATPQQAICELVEREAVDLIVMGTVSRTGIPGFIIGNAAESVLSAAHCSMLTVKPEGFVSPVVLDRMADVA